MQPEMIRMFKLEGFILTTGTPKKVQLYYITQAKIQNHVIICDTKF